MHIFNKSELRVLRPACDKSLKRDWSGGQYFFKNICQNWKNTHKLIIWFI